jgi:hypothetical protein
VSKVASFISPEMPETRMRGRTDEISFTSNESESFTLTIYFNSSILSEPSKRPLPGLPFSQ